jgi:hypothetical protein
MCPRVFCPDAAGNGAKRKRTHAEGDEGEENEEDGGGGAVVDDRYRGCDGTTRAVRKRVVASLADALSFSVVRPSRSGTLFFSCATVCLLFDMWGHTFN